MVKEVLDTATTKAIEIISALDVAWAAKVHTSLSQTRGKQTLYLDQQPTLLIGKDGAVIGIDAHVRLFEGGVEIPIDPHRRIVNPPLLVPDGGKDEKGRDTYVRAAEAAYWQVLWDSVTSVPNTGGWQK